MIPTLLATTALAGLLAAGAVAQDTPAPADPNATTTEAPADPNATTTEAPAEQPAETTTTETPAEQPAETTTETPAETTTETPPAEDATTDATSDAAATDAAEEDAGFDFATGYTVADTDDLATQIVGANVWSSNAEGSENIGNINDLVIGEDGSVEAVIIGVGGFLGMGEKNVAVAWSELSWEVAPDGNEVLVFPTTAEALTAAPDFVWEDDDTAAPAQ
jgi:hypothetical protein